MGKQRLSNEDRGSIKLALNSAEINPASVYDDAVGIFDGYLAGEGHGEVCFNLEMETQARGENLDPIDRPGPVRNCYPGFLICLTGEGFNKSLALINYTARGRPI